VARSLPAALRLSCLPSAFFSKKNFARIGGIGSSRESNDKFLSGTRTRHAPRASMALVAPAPPTLLPKTPRTPRTLLQDGPPLLAPRGAEPAQTLLQQQDDGPPLLTARSSETRRPSHARMAPAASGFSMSHLLVCERGILPPRGAGSDRTAPEPGAPVVSSRACGVINVALHEPYMEGVQKNSTATSSRESQMQGAAQEQLKRAQAQRMQDAAGPRKCPKTRKDALKDPKAMNERQRQEQQKALHAQQQSQQNARALPQQQTGDPREMIARCGCLSPVLYQCAAKNSARMHAKACLKSARAKRPPRRQLRHNGSTSIAVDDQTPLEHLPAE